MTHQMKLQSAPFLAIKSGRKKIEMRLFDEKRSLIKVGDMVEFTDVKTGEKLLCTVVNMHRYPTFADLYANHTKEEIGYTEGEQADPADMLAYYSQEEIARYGVVGIELTLL